MGHQACIRLAGEIEAQRRVPAKEKGTEAIRALSAFDDFFEVYCSGLSEEVAAAVELARITPD